MVIYTSGRKNCFWLFRPQRLFSGLCRKVVEWSISPYVINSGEPISSQTGLGAEEPTYYLAYFPRNLYENKKMGRKEEGTHPL